MYNAFLAELLPKIIRQKSITDNAPMQLLANYFVDLGQSPFRESNLQFWIQEKLEETALLTAGSYLPNRCANDGLFSGQLANKTIRFTVGLTLRCGKMQDEFLDVLTEYLDSDFKNKSVFPYLQIPQKMRWWVAEHPAQQAMASKGKDMFFWYQFEEEKKKKWITPRVQFAVRETYLYDDDEAPSARLELFSDGQMIVNSTIRQTT